MKSSSVIEAKFLRHKLNAVFTKPWGNANPQEQQQITEGLQFSEQEHIALYYFPNAHYRWILTTQQIIICHPGSTQYLPFEEIIKIDVQDMLDDSIAKQDIEVLPLEGRHGRILLKVKKGTWYAIYNIIKFVISKTKPSNGRTL